MQTSKTNLVLPSLNRKAFTLIELLTVVAIIGILATILIPTIGHVRISANKAKVKVQLNQWATALEGFRSAYGYYPPIDGANEGVNVPANVLNSSTFAIALTGRKINGDSLSATDKKYGNTKLLSLYTFSDSEIDKESSPVRLVDAFGNKEIAVLYDKNGDNMIKTDDVPTLPSLNAKNGGRFTPTTDDLDLTKGIRAGVIFYTPGNGNVGGGTIDSSDAVFSNK